MDLQNQSVLSVQSKVMQRLTVCLLIVPVSEVSYGSITTSVSPPTVNMNQQEQLHHHTKEENKQRRKGDEKEEKRRKELCCKKTLLLLKNVLSSVN